MSSPIDIVLSRLSNVKPRPNGKGYLASCPTGAHRRGDKHASLAVDVGDHGGVIFYCFSQLCSAAEIVDALGLTLADLFPDRPNDPNYHGGGSRLPTVPWQTFFEGVETDLVAASMAFADFAKGKRAWSPEDAEFLAGRCNHLAEAVRRMREGQRQERMRGHGR